MAGKKIVAISAAIGLAAAATAFAAPTNGGFEQGNFNGWERTEPGGGRWLVYDASGEAPLDPPVGEFAAGVEQGDPGLNILHRNLNAKDGRFLSFYLAYDNSSSGAFFAPKSFKFDGELDNQQLRVDLLRKDAKIKSLRRRDILETVFRTKEGSGLAQPYEFYVVDLEDEGINGKFRFRVAEVDNQGPFFVGFDELYQSDLVP